MNNKFTVLSRYKRFSRTLQVGGRVATVEDGINRVIESSDEHPWAFVAETGVLTYAARRRCNLQLIADWRGSFSPYRYLSLATPLGSPYHGRLSQGVLQLLEEGMVHRLHGTWWYSRTQCDPEV